MDNKEYRRKKLENKNHKKSFSYHDDDKKVIRDSKKAFKQKKRSLIDQELSEEIDKYY